MATAAAAAAAADGESKPEQEQRPQPPQLQQELCCCRFLCVTPREDPLEFSSCLSIILLVLGVVLISFGYLVPRHYTQDDGLTARQNEHNAIYYYRLGRQMDVCILVGISVLSLGSIMLSVVLSYTLYRHERSKAAKAAGDLAK